MLKRFSLLILFSSTFLIAASCERQQSSAETDPDKSSAPVEVTFILQNDVSNEGPFPRQRSTSCVLGQTIFDLLTKVVDSNHLVFKGSAEKETVFLTHLYGVGTDPARDAFWRVTINNEPIQFGISKQDEYRCETPVVFTYVPISQSPYRQDD